MANNVIYDVGEFIKKFSELNCYMKKLKVKLDSSNLKEVIEEDKKNEKIIQESLGDLLTNKNIDGNESEIVSWINSLPVLANILGETGLNKKSSAQIVLEAHYGSSERADVVIVGTRKAKNKTEKDKDKTVPTILIIENKQWSDLAKNYPAATDSCLQDNCHNHRLVVHPCMQVERYRFIMENTNKYVQEKNVEVYTAVFMQNVEESEVKAEKGLFDKSYLNKGIFEKNPVFIKYGNYSELSKIEQNCFKKNFDDLKDYNLRDYINEIFNVASSNEKKSYLAEDIYESDLQYSENYQNAIAGIFNRENLIKLLDEQQLAIFDNIKRDISQRKQNSNKKIVYIIQGSTGTGKSFLALALLSYLYQNTTTSNKDNENSCVTAKLFMKNLDPRKFYRVLYGKKIVDSVIKYGLKEDFEKEYDCLICDETHRMPKDIIIDEKTTKDRIKSIIEQSYISVFFYDKKQSISVEDYITIERIIDRIKEIIVEKSEFSKELEFVIRMPVLTYQHRIMNDLNNDTGYLDLINRILYPEEKIVNNIKKNANGEKQKNTYEVKLVEKPETLKSIIKRRNRVDTLGKLNGVIRPSRMLAGKGSTKIESKFVDWNWNKAKMTVPTIGPLGDSGKSFCWDDFYNKDDESFFMDCKSVGRVGCVDSSQGLDFEYAGVIIAPELTSDGKNVKVRPEYHRLFDNKLKGDDEERKRIIRNTYYVLLSRGVRGCYIYCCDKKLEEYLHEEEKIPYFKFIGGTKYFHYDWCRFAPNRKFKVFSTTKEAREAELKPCQHCNPVEDCNPSFLLKSKKNIFHFEGCQFAPKEKSDNKFSTTDAIKMAINNSAYKPCKFCKPWTFRD